MNKFSRRSLFGYLGALSASPLLPDVPVKTIDPYAGLTVESYLSIRNFVLQIDNSSNKVIYIFDNKTTRDLSRPSINDSNINTHKLTRTHTHHKK